MIFKLNLFNKLNKKDYNNFLETILEKKRFDINTKNTLLSIFYKIENSYSDYSKVKPKVLSEEDFIKKILYVVECESREIHFLENEENINEELKKITLEKEKGILFTYLNENVFLYSLMLLLNNDVIIPNITYKEAIVDFINKAVAMEYMEIIRDFNGWSWDICSNEIINQTYNWIFQIINILDNRNENGILLLQNIDIEETIEYFKKEYDIKIIERMMFLIYKLIVLSYASSNQEAREIYIKEQKELKSELKNMNNKEEFFEKINSRKEEIKLKINKLSKILKNNDLLEKEYVKQSNKDNNFFSIKHFKEMTEDERNRLKEELEDVENLLDPDGYDTKRDDIEKKIDFIKELTLKSSKIEVNKIIEEIQKLFLKCIEIKLDKSEEKQEVLKIIYILRYYLLIKYEGDNIINDVKNINKDINKLEEKIINKAIELELIEKVSNDKNENHGILKYIFTTKIIDFDDINLIIQKQKDKCLIKYLDGKTEEDKNIIESNILENISIKLNKKTKVFITR